MILKPLMILNIFMVNNVECSMVNSDVQGGYKMKHKYKLWTELPYAGESTPPTNPEQPFAGSWPMYYLKRSNNGGFKDLNGNPITLEIKDPNTIHWNQQLKIVQKTLATLTPKQITIAKYWGTGVPTKQFTPIIDRLIDTYGLTASKADRFWLLSTQE